MTHTLVRLVACAVLACAVTGTSHAQIEAGDSAWVRRAESVDDDLAAPDRVEESAKFYRMALEADPVSLEARWKLLRALHYAVDFTTLDDEAKDARVAEMIAQASTATAALAASGGTDSDRARLMFWSAIAWGTRARRVGPLTVVREGAATRMHDYAMQSLALDPSVDRGGAFRLLSRLHAELPRVPYITGWVDRDESLLLAERGHALDATHPGNRLVLALALLEQAPDRRNEARSLLESVASVDPRPGFRVEDRVIRDRARDELEALGVGEE